MGKFFTSVASIHHMYVKHTHDEGLRVCAWSGHIGPVVISDGRSTVIVCLAPTSTEFVGPLQTITPLITLHVVFLAKFLG